MRRFSLALLCAALLPTVAIDATALVNPTISEVRIDHPGVVDSDEFIELGYLPDVTLSNTGLIILGDSADGVGGSGVVEQVIDLGVISFDATATYVIAEAGFTLGTANLTLELNLENNDNLTILLVNSPTASVGDDLDTNDDGILDVFPWSGNPIDVLALVQEANPPTGTEYHYGPPETCSADRNCTALGPDGRFVPAHVYRCEAFTGEWVIGSFAPTDGTDNPGEFAPCPSAADPDADMGGDAGFGRDVGTDAVGDVARDSDDDETGDGGLLDASDLDGAGGADTDATPDAALDAASDITADSSPDTTDDVALDEAADSDPDESPDAVADAVEDGGAEDVGADSAADTGGDEGFEAEVTEGDASPDGGVDTGGSGTARETSDEGGCTVAGAAPMRLPFFAIALLAWMAAPRTRRRSER